MDEHSLCPLRFGFFHAHGMKKTPWPVDNHMTGEDRFHRCGLRGERLVKGQSRSCFLQTVSSWTLPKNAKEGYPNIAAFLQP